MAACTHFMIMFLLVVGIQTIELTVHYMDQDCGANIDSSSRITCEYQSQGIYKSENIYKNVEMITFTRFGNSLLDCRTFPNISWFVVESFLENVCKRVILSAGQSVTIQWRDDMDSVKTQTCIGSESVRSL